MKKQSTAADFWARVETGPANRCWPFKGAIVRGGYGCLSFQRTRIMAHRLAWTLTHGPIPSGMVICHHCDNPPCCNPGHLFIGTIKDNNVDMGLKRRNAPGGIPPPKLSWEQVNAIRAIYENGKRPQTFRQTAKQFGVTPPAISQIVNGRIRKPLRVFLK
jgi:hypothetical protein